MITFTTATSDEELQQILDLQQANLPANISEEEMKSQGFVTLEYDFETLKKLGIPYPHVIAKAENKVVGYALITTKEWMHQILPLRAAYQELKVLSYEGEILADSNHFMMGQICIAKGYRGQGIFSGLYKQMQQLMSSNFEYLITFISVKNTRSQRAHQKVGFQVIHVSEKGGWQIVLWDWSRG